MKNFIKNTNFFTIITKLILIILPLYVLLTVSLKTLTWINFIWFFFKEFLLILAFFALIFEFFKAKKFPKFDLIDFLIFSFIWYGIFITFVNWLGFKSIFYGWRYDFIFLIAFLIYKHWSQFLKESKENLLKIFLISASISLFLGILVKFTLKEEILLFFGYTEYDGSSWLYKGWIPNYHWLENSGIRRFQWILDWPNMMGFFLILYAGFFTYLQKNKKEFYVFLVLIFLAILVYLTYSRSAMLWVLAWTWVIILANLKNIFIKYKNIFIYVIIWFLIFFIPFWFLYSGIIKHMLIRESSTTWHFYRMQVWIERFIKKPFWSWLAESWPAFRNIYPKKQDIKWEHYYIPESWFIQVLVEGWIIYFILFLSILWIILQKLYKKSFIIFWTFFAILVMNVFLHIFEATYLSVMLFILIWIILYKD